MRLPPLSARIWRAQNVLLILIGFILPSFRGCENEPISTAQQVGSAAQKGDQWVLLVILLMPILYGVLSLLRAFAGSPRSVLWRAAPLALYALNVGNMFRSQLEKGLDQTLPGLWVAGVAVISSIVQEAVEAAESPPESSSGPTLPST